MTSFFQSSAMRICLILVWVLLPIALLLNAKIQRDTKLIAIEIVEPTPRPPAQTYMAGSVITSIDDAIYQREALQYLQKRWPPGTPRSKIISDFSKGYAHDYEDMNSTKYTGLILFPASKLPCLSKTSDYQVPVPVEFDSSYKVKSYGEPKDLHFYLPDGLIQD